MGEKKEKKSKKKDAPAEEKAADAPAAAAPAKKKTVNVFALFKQAQISEFKEAFALMDLNKDGVLDEADIKGIWQQAGRDVDDKTAADMIAECTGQLNFTKFLQLFGDKMHGADGEATLKECFSMFDKEKNGKIDEAYFKDLLTNTGDQFDKEEIKQTWAQMPVEGGKIDFEKFVMYIKRGKEEAEAAIAAAAAEAS